MEHDREAAEHDLTWIDRLIESERAWRARRPPRRPDLTARLIGRHARPRPGPSAPSIAELRSAISQEDKTP